MLIEETDDRFYLKESTVPNAGMGVFSKEDIEKGEFLEIIGVQVKMNSIADQCTQYANKYKFAATGKLIKEQKKIEHDRLVMPVGFGGMVNHAPSAELQNAEIWYRQGAKRNSAAGQAVYRFIRNIKKDEEILGNYGEEWQGVMDWVGEKAEEVENDWETFLSHNLYSLGELSTKMDYKE